jgi:hypothetical protein
MKTFDVQAVELDVPAGRAFDVIADPARLPEWAEAFVSADRSSAVLRTPAGTARIALAVDAQAASGTVDWRMTFPDGSLGRAHSRVVALDDQRCVYAFVLHAPPVPLEAIEGALDAQRATLARELQRLKHLLEGA